MGDGAVGADDGWHIGNVDHRKVLNVGVRANLDVVGLQRA